MWKLHSVWIGFLVSIIVHQTHFYTSQAELVGPGRRPLPPPLRCSHHKKKKNVPAFAFSLSFPLFPPPFLLLLPTPIFLSFKNPNPSYSIVTLRYLPPRSLSSLPASMALEIEEGRVERYLNLGTASFRTSSTVSASSAIPSPSEAAAAPALVISNSGKRIEHHQAGRKKKYVKQVTGRHNDTELHVAARLGDAAAVRRIMEGIGAHLAAEGGAAVEAEAAEIREAVADETNEVGYTPMIAAAERGHLEVVVELLKYADGEGVSRKNRSGFDAFHMAAREGHAGIFGSSL